MKMHGCEREAGILYTKVKRVNQNEQKDVLPGPSVLRNLERAQFSCCKLSLKS